MVKRWYAIYTRPRWEKKVDKLLFEKGIESYCPLNKVRRKWSDRIKTIEEPLFKSYVFIKVAEEEKLEVRTTTGVVNFVYWNGKPAVIKEKEIIAIKNFLDEHENVQLEKIEIAPNDRVKILKGPFIDKEGQVVKVEKKKIRLLIESLGYILTVNLQSDKIQLLK